MTGQRMRNIIKSINYITISTNYVSKGFFQVPKNLKDFLRDWFMDSFNDNWHDGFVREIITVRRETLFLLLISGLPNSKSKPSHTISSFDWFQGFPNQNRNHLILFLPAIDFRASQLKIETISYCFFLLSISGLPNSNLIQNVSVSSCDWFQGFQTQN